MNNNPPPIAPPSGNPIAVAFPVGLAEDAIPSAPPLETSNDIPVVPDDDANEARAAAARIQGTAMIRDHLRHHLSQNPRSSYVTWIATLHPENATVAIDPRFLKPGNPWITVYQEAKLDMYEGAASVRHDPLEGEGSKPTGTTEDKTGQIGTEPDLSQPKLYGGFLDLVVGFAVVLSAVAIAFSIEVCAAYVYISEALCCKIKAKCSPVGFFSVLPFLVSWILSKSFRFLDIILLLASVLLAELIAALNFFLCSLLALSWEVGKSAHQRTRRHAHLTRWAFRQRFKTWTPTRAAIGTRTEK
mmetsp:Transcript_11092/g.23262  ORF Transcript_11092/g.23262 Transcript_11092/m.23262 type:complete len:301 (-) Transcript_11092:129-1031(-)|eukprot:CAMPEP_0183309204 /NCGR_PEP_ID=MMETSP0160_2-20130417/24484_1 /TAXON_ID=2839 ORGANISM="Odontella Sinensis, Strain Grunow 1884" /NCGR_SAMPLE_ID=MMETSP0160_2 /ASSEMBLY_ACC=CAM_ASM_000250 /LENGTH=300 /DNA_ID=CAMNT_0025473199 /DNA_START=22 /DNA_END=924 /DNA_ORIENTATION=-